MWGADIYQIGLNISLAKILFAEIKIYSLELKCKDVREDELQKEKGQYIKYFPKYAITPWALETKGGRTQKLGHLGLASEMPYL